MLRKKISLFLFTGLVAFNARAQQPFHLDAQGEVTDARFPAFVAKHQYEVISAFDTAFKKPLLIYAIYVKNKKMGILDNYGREVTPAIYDKIIGPDDANLAFQRGPLHRYLVENDGK